MSSHDYKSAQRPQPDDLLVALADYTANYRVDSRDAYETAKYNLMDSLACCFQALKYPACTKLLGPVVPGATMPGGSRVPGTSFELDPVMGAFSIGAMVRWLDFNDTWLAAEWGHPSDNLGAILAISDYLSRRAILLGEKPMLASFHGKNLPPKVCTRDGGMTYCEDWELRPSVYVIEGKPRVPDYAYSKRVIFLDKETFMIPYSDLVALVNSVHFNAFDQRLFSMLGKISLDEDEQGRPLLSVLVVHKNGDMKPGPGFFELAASLGRDVRDADKAWITETQKVFQYWNK